jgi:hypothetical protein
VRLLCLFQWTTVAGILVLLSLTSAVFGSSAGDAPRVTNMALLEKATSEAVDYLVQGLPSALKAPVYLRPAIQHPAVWMIENELGSELRNRGIQVVVSKSALPPPVSGSALTDTTSAGDSLETAAEAMPEMTVESITLEYRITELGINYPRAWRGHLIGRKKVERNASVALHGRLIEDSSGKLLWSGEGSATAGDVVPASELLFLEGDGEPWQKGELPAGKIGGVVEPLVVAAIVAGLVYLFYSNKE